MIGMGTTIFLVNPVNFGGGASYLLDTYSATSAYSLRQLKTGVTNVVRVRRSSDSAESDFTATEITDGTLTTWTGANDGFVVTWYNQSGSGNNITQSTAASQPKLVSSGTLITENGLPCIQFDGSDDILGTAFNIQPYGTNFSQWVVTTIPSNANSYMLSGSLNGGGAAIIANFVGSSVEHFVGGGDRDNYLASSTSGQQKLFNLNITDGSTLTTYTNGSNVVSTSPSTTYNGGYFRRIGSSASGSYSDINFQEYILFSSDESANRTAIEADINTHYSIY
jgi:hypothetical protein